MEITDCQPKRLLSVREAREALYCITEEDMTENKAAGRWRSWNGFLMENTSGSAVDMRRKEKNLPGWRVR